MNTIEVSIAPQLTGFQLEMLPKNPRSFIRKILKAVLEAEGAKNKRISLTLIDDQQMQELNGSYRKLDEPTDILTFAQADGQAFPKAPGQEDVMGDVFISLDTLKRNSECFNVSPLEELVRLLIHGYLHLSGANHQTNDASEPMLIRQEQILESFKGRLF
ncbi:MAG: rRNA maturation RNase YbeY [Sphaerochaetaceae bacterium]|jgi:probable rRNA maturation factor|nr:rRNA maturation RNase YbeY [Sphaerochaetaceae bacterium]